MRILDSSLPTLRFGFGRSMTFALALGLLAVGCGGDDSPGDGADEAGSETAGESGTDEDVGESGESASSSDTESTSNDTEPTTDTNTDESCPIGAEGCECTPGGGCDPGLVCELGTCTAGSADTNDTDADTTDTTDTDTTDTTDGTDTTDTTDTEGGACDPAPGDDECTSCNKESCCDAIEACAADEDCTCMSECVNDGGNFFQCGQQCGVMGPNQTLQELFGCTQQFCGQACF